ncbi:MAG: type II secretion system protein J [Sphingobacteriaceae bacterium]|jgi:prepilin-type N-terminal cleavage/methylation domain-containing protein
MKLALNKLKGFTLIEVLITMCISTVIIMLSYSTFTFINKQFHNYKDQNNFLYKYVDLKHKVTDLFQSAISISSNSESEIKFITDTLVTSLEFNSNYILMRKKALCDTFYFKESKVNIGFLKEDKMNHLVEELTIETTYSSQQFKLNFQKEYDASSLLNQLQDGQY